MAFERLRPRWPSSRRLAAFVAGMAVLWVVVGSPLSTLDHALLTFHMVQHLLLMTVAAPLILWGGHALAFRRAGDLPVECRENALAPEVWQAVYQRIIENYHPHGAIRRRCTQISSGRMWKADVAEIPKIAVVDDDESVRDALRSLLKSVGFKAEAFASAAELLNSGQLLGLACLILDVRMPGMSGIELQDRLTASHDGVPIIFISAHADEEARARALASGAIAFLVKPFSDEALLDAIEVAVRLPR